MHFNSDHVYMIGRVTRRMLPHLWGPRIQCKQALRGSFPSLSLSLSPSLSLSLSLSVSLSLLLRGSKKERTLGTRMSFELV